MLYARYISLTRGQAYTTEINSSSRQRGCYISTMITKVHMQKKKIMSGRDSKGPRRQGEVTGATPPIVK
jgi:hypothetical protein